MLAKREEPGQTSGSLRGVWGIVQSLTRSLTGGEVGGEGNADEEGDVEDLLWEVEKKEGWTPLDADTCRRLSVAVAQGKASESYQGSGRSGSRGSFVVDLRMYVQTDEATGRQWRVRSSKMPPKETDADSDDASLVGRCLEPETVERIRSVLGDILRFIWALTCAAWELVRQGAGLAHAKFRELPVGQQVPVALGGSLGVVLLLLFLLNLGRHHSAAPPGVVVPVVPTAPTPAPAPQPTPSSPTTAWKWRMCQSQGDCGGADIFKRWQVSPRDLAGQVDTDLASVPSIPALAWDLMASRWRQAPPTFQGSVVPLSEVAAFMRELLASDPFETGDQVPFVDFRPPIDGKALAVTQRQLAFIVANSFMGNKLTDTNNGLASALHRCSKMGKSGYLFSLMSFLAVMSRELQGGKHGTMLVAATPAADDGSWKQRLDQGLAEPTICRRAADGSGFDCGLADFMSGGTPNQALVDIAGGVVGGGAQLCDVAASQDESLVQFYSEVLALAFFTAAGNPDDAASGMLPSPIVVLGARRYMRELTGESMAGSCGKVQESNWLNEEMPTATVTAVVADSEDTFAASAFVGVASVCSQCHAGASCTHEDVLNNACDSQRRHLDEDLALWQQAFQPTLYNMAVQEAFRAIVKRIGTGPWGAGVWYGDSQQYFLAVWLATSLLGGPTLDYYVYDAFCENQGNQCFVLGNGEDCGGCIARGALPGIGISASKCGPRGIKDIVAQFRGRPARDLYVALTKVPPPPGQVFDLLEGA